MQRTDVYLQRLLCDQQGGSPGGDSEYELMDYSSPEKNESEGEQDPKFCCNLCTLNTARSLILCMIIVTVATVTTAAIIAASTIRVSVCSLRSSIRQGVLFQDGSRQCSRVFSSQ